MSEILGPIHHWLFNKIQLQEELIKDIAASSDIKCDVDREAFVNKELRPLEELIDTDNIHGWLQNAIHDAEGRYAKLVTAILSSDSSAIDPLKEIAFKSGAKHPAGKNEFPTETYKHFQDFFVNGMPCDMVNSVVDQNNEHVVWEELQDLHSSYWKDCGGDPANYYILRAEIMKGMLAETDKEFREIEPQRFEIVRR
ncbi:MAG: hypothetical protein K6F39_07745 [Lachnospiraceae bacterium]|nr:hypothetical protein [Lachnospiraceae bacterium]